MDIIDDVLDFIGALGDKAREQAVIQAPSVGADNKAITETTIHDLFSVLSQKTLPEVR